MTALLIALMSLGQVAAPAPVARPAVVFPTELVDWVPYEHNPVLAGTGGDTWDNKIRERGYILYEDGQFHLWYTGYRGASADAKHLGYATSPDGLQWTRWPTNPIHAAGWVEDVCVVKVGAVYHMFAEGRDDIAHLLLSRDRVHWEEQGPLDIRQTSGAKISAGPYGTPTVWHEGDTWNLFYERRDLGVWLARSKDLKIWTNVDDRPVLALGPDKYDRSMIAMDQVIQYAGWYYAYYHALAERGSTNWTTCIAASNDLVHWTKYAGNPIIDGNKSSAVLVNDGRQMRLYTMHPDVRVYLPKTPR